MRIACSLTTIGCGLALTLSSCEQTQEPAAAVFPLTSSGPIDWLMFEGNASDSSDQSNNGTLPNGGTYVTGKSGQAINLNGTSQYVDGPSLNGFTAGNQITIAAWAKATTVNGTQRIVLQGGRGSNEDFFRIEFDPNNKARIGFGNGVAAWTPASNFVEGTTVLTAGTWYHIAGLWDGSSIQLFVNGAQEGSSLLYTGGTGKPSGVTIGKFNGGPGFEFPGAIDDVRIYNRALSASEIQSLYGQFTAYYNFDEGSGATAQDRSGDGNDANLINGASWVPGVTGQAVQLDGTSQYVDGPSLNGFTAGNQITIAAWAKATTVNGTQRIVLQGGRGSNEDFFFRIEFDPNNKARIGFGNGVVAWTPASNFVEGTTVLTAGTWYHIAGLWDGSSIKLFVNGAQEGSSLPYTGGTAKPTGVTIGKFNGRPGFEFPGAIDDVRIYNRALAATEIQSLYQAASPPPSGTLSWAERAAQPGVVMAVQMASLSEIQAGADIRTPAPGFVTYDATEKALRIDVPATLGTPANSWAKSLPYPQQFDAGSEMWIQFEAKWDTGMLTPSNGGGGIKFFTIDEGTQSDGFVSGSCDNGGNFPMEGQIVGHIAGPQPAWRFPTLYHACNLYEPLVTGNNQFQNQRPLCTYTNVNTGQPDDCIRLLPDVWHTFTMRVKIGTWSPTADPIVRAGHQDSQIDLWMAQGPNPSVYLHSQPGYALINYSPGQARYGKLWLLPYDTNRVSSSVDGHVWYRNVLMASQPLKDPLTGAVMTPAGSPPAGPLAALPANGWLTITPNPSTRYIPGGDPSPGGAVTVPATPTAQSSPVSREFSGITYGNGMLAYFGGGHGGYPGNDVELYHIAANVWEQSYKPEVCLNITQPCGPIYGGSTSPYPTPLGRPYVEHMFQQTLFRSDLNVFEIATRGVGPYQFDPVAKTMTRSPTVTNPQGVNYPWGNDVSKEHAFWAPDIFDRLVIISSGGTGAGVWRQDPVTLQWNIVAPIPALGGDGTYYSTYVSSRRQHFMVLIARTGVGAQPNVPKTWWWFDARTLTFTPATPPAGLEVVDAVEYDSKNDRLLAIQDSVDPIKLWVGTPDAATWTALPLTASPGSNAPSKQADVRSALPTWQYDPVDNVFWYVNFQPASSPIILWAYRYEN